MVSHSIPAPRRAPLFKLCTGFGAFTLCLATSAISARAATLVVDDFESGVAAWSANDKIKSANPNQPATLVNVVAVPADPGGVRGSKGAALFTFKAAKASWASASRSVDGKEWAKIGAQTLSFYLSSSGSEQGFEVLLRGRFFGADGLAKEEKFQLSKRVDLDRRPRLVTIPLSDFRSENGPLAPRLAGVYLLQVVQVGDWDARFFTIDDIRLEGSGTPIPQKINTQPPPTPTPAPLLAPTPVPGSVVSVNVDFLKREGRIRSAANVSLGMTWPDTNGVEVFPLDNKSYRDTLATLKPRLVRLDAGSLCALMDSSRPSFDFTKLVQAVRHARALGIEPLVALTNPVAWGLDEKGYASFAAQTARAVNSSASGSPSGGAAGGVRLFELAVAAPSSASGEDDVLVLAYYNRAYEALKALSKNYWVGGVTASGGRANTLAKLLSGARGIDFLTLQFSGAPFSRTGTPASTLTTEQINRAATAIPSLHYAAERLDKSRFPKVPIFVTQANLAAPGADGEQPSDVRVAQMTSAAWWIAFMGTGSRVSDQIFHNDAANAAWGLLDAQPATPRAYPAYSALWLWNSYLPAGSERVQATSSNPVIAVTAANVPGPSGPPVHSVLLANLTDDEQTVKVAIRGFPILREARARVFDDLAAARALHTPQTLSKSPFQTLVLRPNAVALVQFIEPPKK